ncbi:LOW QUALITY PROTEIN: protein O-linked-mannose beta-1,2-N-acetylglucosaminyltransferase 1-like [Pollicipes pollicipes]|uniref:LOW QUALITY PROTEIN: protein O-linked-mannose beta-1,2-N-acetylglucosaminyltransferase 1-like n=1 Tax=Pollicipes pollicipes TaxID=41117 RepID=UPI001884B2C7|nr:LOW QUALITY PROTEIN: protein O-linked-mannose beta-1,2-N-acetylglucosaminyltransferase 1-like [Pollicipes pollicipes]
MSGPGEMWCRIAALVLLCCCGPHGTLSRKIAKHDAIEREVFDAENAYAYSPRPKKPKTLLIDLSTNKHNATLHVNGRLTWWHSLADEQADKIDPQGVQRRGLYALALHPVTGRVQGEGLASGWMQLDTAHALREMVRDSRRGDLLLLFSIGEIGPGLQETEETVRFMERMGAQHFTQRQENDLYALVKVKDGAVLAETFVRNPLPGPGQPPKPGSPLLVSVTAPVPPIKDVLCPWQKTPKNLKLAKFCFKYDGYGDLCDCKSESSLPIGHEQLEHNNLTDVPIAVVASNRPQALFRMMKSLLKNRGVIASNIIVFVDGEHKEVDDLCQLLDIKCVSQVNDWEDVTMRIREHYHQVLTNVWHHFPDATRVIVLEEDLEVSPDFVSFFSQTSYLLDVDPSLWCISAWNDHGFDITSSDPALLYRIEYMPGLGWMMKRSVIQELLDKWPEKGEAYDWDVWVRWDRNRLERECVIPDVSRTYHFGIAGRHSSSAFHSMYYVDHAFNRKPDVELRGVQDMVKDRYEQEIRRLLSEALPINPDDFQLSKVEPKDGGDCELELTSTGKTYAFFFSMTAWEDTEMYSTVCKCFKIWDLDVRGHHHGLWRFTYYDNNVLLFGVPITMYMNDVVKHFSHPVQVVSSLKHAE